MSQQNPVVMVPTAMQQRLQWKPVKGAAFRQLSQFLNLLQVYSFATGKKYIRTVVANPKEINFVCKACRQGNFYLHIHRRNAKLYWWVVRSVVTCDCGSPPTLLEDLKSNGPAALVGKYVGKKSEWKSLAHACFPCGYVCDRSQSSRIYSISCKREHCNGQMNITLQYVRGGAKYDTMLVSSVIDCSTECKEVGNQNAPIVVRTPPANDRVCRLCYQDQLDQWITLPCCDDKVKYCHDCFGKLVQSCPSSIMKEEKLVVFDPDNNADHCYNCPFCRAPYTPRTKLVQHRVQNDHVPTLEVEVHNLVTIPYAYQSFDLNLPAHIPTVAQYQALQGRLQDQWDEVAAANPPAEEPIAGLDGVAQENFAQLRSLREDGMFRDHQHAVLNFIEAVEYLHKHGMDDGFLRRIANEADNNQRRNLIQSAYEVGWNQRDNIHMQLVFNLLERNGLVEVIDLVSDDDSS